MRRLHSFSKIVVVAFWFCAGLLTGRSSLDALPGGSVRIDRAGAETADSAPVASAAAACAANGAAIPISARTIARQALDYTVYLRGGRVYGAGVLIDQQGHVLTADHVLDGVQEMHAYFHDDLDAIAVKVIERDAKLDLALLRLERLPEGKRPARLGSVVDMEMGDDVYAMGAPRKMQFSLSRGIVSYVGRPFRGTVYLQTDLTANEGSSGGPVMNDRGELIGVASFILRNSQGLAFAVPVDYAYGRFDAMAGQLDGAPFRGWLAARQPSDADTPTMGERSVAGAGEPTGL